MPGLFRTLAGWNAAMSRTVDGLLPDKFAPRPNGAPSIRGQIPDGATVADVGGGKKPLLNADEVRARQLDYWGIDISADELANAPVGVYAHTRVLDLTADIGDLEGRFDVVICGAMLEHVRDTEAALCNIVRILRPGGICIIGAPCRHAIFARVNSLLPEQVKRRLLHTIFPHKEGDGFPAYYDRLSPPEVTAMIEAQGAKVIVENRRYWSSYFTWFFPLYLIWRALSLVQYFLHPAYCERFLVIFERPQLAAAQQRGERASLVMSQGSSAAS